MTSFFYENSDVSLPEKGDLLISEPFLSDDFFSRTVVLLCEHSEEGSVGLVLNKSSLFNFNEIVKVDDFNKKLFFGGPVDKSTLNFVYKRDYGLVGSSYLGNNLYWGGDFDHLITLINNKEVNPDDFRFFLGYSGWESGQLINELNSRSWIVSKSATANQVIGMTPKSLWKDMLGGMGGKFKMFSNYPTNPTLN